jgi:hypothetical protein
VLAAVIVAALALAVPHHAGPAQSGLVHFQSPSGNINCLGGGAGSGQPAFVQCLVKKATWATRVRKPASCDLDFDPQTLSLSNRKTSIGSCRGDIGPLCVPKYDACRTLAYGRFVDIGPIRCSSATTGVTCRYRTAPQVGFRIAREGFVIYR